MIEVVAGVIVRDNRILLAQRPYTTSYGGKWCSPGGKVEAGETRWQALERELKEELGVACAHITGDTIAQWIGHPPYVPRSLRVTFLPAALDEEPMPVEFIDLGWFTIPEMRGLAIAESLVPANQMMWEDIAEFMGRGHDAG